MLEAKVGTQCFGFRKGGSGLRHPTSVNKCFPIVLDLDDLDDPSCYGMEQIEKAKFRLEELCEPIWPTVEIVWK
jgi:hypothetical protein